MTNDLHPVNVTIKHQALGKKIIIPSIHVCAFVENPYLQISSRNATAIV